MLQRAVPPGERSRSSLNSIAYLVTVAHLRHRTRRTSRRRIKIITSELPQGPWEVITVNFSQKFNCLVGFDKTGASSAAGLRKSSTYLPQPSSLSTKSN